jgi:hypothetical protein
MANRPSDIPPAPRPSAASPRDGAERAKALAQRYLPDLVLLHAAIALGDPADASLHTRAYSAKELRELASGVPPAVPPAPPPHDGGDGGERSAS